MAKIADHVGDLVTMPIFLANSHFEDTGAGEIVVHTGWYIWRDQTVHDEPEEN